MLFSTGAWAVSLDDIQKRYMSHTDYVAAFTQETYQILVDKNILFKGKISFKRDTGVRMDVLEPQRQIIILKDSKVQINLPDDGVSDIQEIPKEIVTQNILGFFSGMTSLDEHYLIRDTGESLILRPKQGRGSIELWVDESNLLKRLSLSDATGNKSTIFLDDYIFDQGLNDVIFVFDPISQGKTQGNKKPSPLPQ